MQVSKALWTDMAVRIGAPFSVGAEIFGSSNHTTHVATRRPALRQRRVVAWTVCRQRASPIAEGDSSCLRRSRRTPADCQGSIVALQDAPQTSSRSRFGSAAFVQSVFGLFFAAGTR